MNGTSRLTVGERLWLVSRKRSMVAGTASNSRESLVSNGDGGERYREGSINRVTCGYRDDCK
jgi:hypothetical protein